MNAVSMYSVLDEGDSQKPLNMQYMFTGNISASHVMIFNRDTTDVVLLIFSTETSAYTSFQTHSLFVLLLTEKAIASIRMVSLNSTLV